MVLVLEIVEHSFDFVFKFLSIVMLYVKKIENYLMPDLLYVNDLVQKNKNEKSSQEAKLMM